MDVFKHLEIGGVPYAYGINRISAVPVRHGCSKCFFDTGNGAKECPMRDSCMGHLRPDRTPVIFIAK